MQMHATSFQRLGRVDDYIRTITRALSEIIGIWKENHKRSSPSGTEPTGHREAPLPLNARDLADEYFAEIVSHCKSMSHSLTLPLLQYFGELRVERQIIHHQDRDGFQLRFTIQNLLQSNIEMDHATVRLVSMEQEAHSEILLTSKEITLKPGTTTIILNCSVSVSDCIGSC
jgi:hypothetical protein